MAVHSAKDVPSELHGGLEIVAVPPRADPRDCVCGGRSLDDLPAAARVGTSSLRRRAQLLARRPDLHVEDLRGNVDTRLLRLAQGHYDAIVLASAGLARLGLDAGQALAIEEMTPAAGQGALALEARAGDEATAAIAALVDDRDSRTCLSAERALVATLGASCRTPIGAHAWLAGDRLTLASFVGVPDASIWIRDTVAGSALDPVELGRHGAERLLRAGARDVLAAADDHDAGAFAHD